MTVADLTILQLYCVIAASVSLFGFIGWALWGTFSENRDRLSVLGYGALAFIAIGGVIYPVAYGLWILYSGIN
ncbi:MAG: hypothetical protein AB3N23_10910 [Paracoccaceae bacterium]